VNPHPHWARPVALGIAWRGRELLVSKGFDSVKKERFYRPLGGTIEFGESGADAIVREFGEEIGAEVEVIRYLATLESIFTCEGVAGHELVRIYEVKSDDGTFYSDDPVRTGGEGISTIWKAVTDFDTEPLYPDGLRELLAE
jgi:ADP-ribose pyrophosphatase YjhB (NUDIX family)